jgi:ABC-type transport system involved in multi-copper enzyme maturation permease subunit
MLYREWLGARLKILVISAMFAATLLIMLVVWLSLKSNSLRTPFYNTWSSISIFLTLTSAIFCSLDLISEEVNKGTISFLLSRPVSRTRLFLTKFGMGIFVLFITYSVFAFLAYGLDRLITFPNVPLLDRPMAELQILGMGGATLLGAFAIFALGSLISVLANNGVVTAGITLALTLLGVFTYVYLFSQTELFKLFQSNTWLNLDMVTYPLISFTGILCTVLGWQLFLRKEF